MIAEEFDHFSHLIAAIVHLTHRLDGSFEQFKAKIQLVDGSYLHINEVYVSHELRKYAYYWVTPTGEVLQGWDNAPHHPEIASYPHHFHQQDHVYPSPVRTLEDVFKSLEDWFSNQQHLLEE